MYYPENNSSRLSTKMASYFSQIHMHTPLQCDFATLPIKMPLFPSRGICFLYLLNLSFGQWDIKKMWYSKDLKKCLNISISASLRTLSHQVWMNVPAKDHRKNKLPTTLAKTCNQHTLKWGYSIISFGPSQTTTRL